MQYQMPAPSMSLLSTKRPADKISVKKKEVYILEDRYDFQGMPISIENKAGNYRTGKDGDGHEWKTFMYYDYGYIRSTEAKDGEAVDVYVNKDGRKSNLVHVIHQKKIEEVKKWKNGICPTCKKKHFKCKHAYDEDKVMLGFNYRNDAIKAYTAQYDSPLFLGPVSTYTVDEFKKHLKASWGKKLPYNRLEKANLEKSYLGQPGDPRGSFAWLRENLDTKPATPTNKIKNKVTMSTYETPSYLKTTIDEILTKSHDSWIGFDLDGTLAKYDGYKGKDYIGEPVDSIKNLIKNLIKQGKKVKIFTARAYDKSAVPPIKKWLKKNGLPDLEITNVKDPGMKKLYDDRAIQVRKNSGILVKGFSDSNEIVIKCSESAVSELVNLLDTLQTMGIHGSSRDIKVDGYGSYGFDGDGSDKIGSITVNGISLKKIKKNKNGKYSKNLMKSCNLFNNKMEKNMEPYSVKKQHKIYSSDEDYMMNRDQGETRQQYDWRMMLESRTVQGSDIWNQGVYMGKGCGKPHGEYDKDMTMKKMEGSHGKKAMDNKEVHEKTEKMYKMYGKPGETMDQYKKRAMYEHKDKMENMEMYKSTKKIVVPIEMQVV